MSFPPVNKTARRAPAAQHGKQMPRPKAAHVAEALRAAPPRPPVARMSARPPAQPRMPGATQGAARDMDYVAAGGGDFGKD